ncbi:hypothetical protein NQ314_017393 [Rhamnusium bicolor]|uniref:Tyr recombinase domain-containing protein n=1 Tax=Rhamnusium bicolor TaxID=1586634 RepID=A0AAV8WUD4_9CUCU|nr:hypothetical protein NQ314_017393 [Rhamnusium bicolor]
MGCRIEFLAYIFGIMAYSRHELHKLEFKDVNVFRLTPLVTIKDSKTKTTRKFTVTGKYYEICKT